MVAECLQYFLRSFFNLLKIYYICNKLDDIMATSIFDFDRSLNALLYVANRLDRRDIHKIFKILYFADMSHLMKYGRAITGDRYIAMNYGPVPSAIYDMVKIVRGDSSWIPMDDLKAFFTVHDKFLEPLRDANPDYLSESDIKELDSSIKKYGKLEFSQITQISHGEAWEKTRNNPDTNDISIEDILRECGADEGYIKYIVENITAQKELRK